jgi:hypothetical protein
VDEYNGKHRFDTPVMVSSEFQSLEFALLRESISHRMNQRATLIAHGFGHQVKHRRLPQPHAAQD